MQGIDLERLVKEHPLILTRQSLEGISSKDIESESGVYFGVGLSNPRGLSRGLPFEVLGMMLTEEQIGEILTGPKHILIADRHALTNGTREEEVKNLAEKYKNTLQRTITNLNLKGWEIKTASELSLQDDNYLVALQEIEELTVNAKLELNNYQKRQFADMLYFKKRNVNVKLGWLRENGRNENSRDELHFDTRAQSVGIEMGFIYIIGGRSFDPNQSHVPPYFSANVDTRVLLCAGENVKEKIPELGENKHKYSKYEKAYLTLLENNVELYHTVFQTPTTSRTQIDRQRKGMSADELIGRIYDIIGECTK